MAAGGVGSGKHQEDDCELGWECSACGALQSPEKHIKASQKLANKISAVQHMLRKDTFNAAQIQKISESLDRTATATSHLLHHFHVLQHTCRIFRFGCAILSKDANQISLAAIRAKAPLQEAQQQNEFAYWIAILDLFSNASRFMCENVVAQSVLRNTLGEDMLATMISTAKALGNQTNERRAAKPPGLIKAKKSRKKKRRRKR